MAKPVKVWSGTAWQDLAVQVPDLSNYSTTTQMNTAISANAGLNLISTQTFSATSLITFNNVFSSTYDNYRIVMKSTSSATSNTYLRLRASGTDNSAASYNWQEINIDGASSTPAKNTSQTSITTFYQYGTGIASLTADVISPAIAESTQFLWQYQRSQNTTILWQAVGIHTVSTAYDGFSLTTSSGTITGTVRVYGYKN